MDLDKIIKSIDRAKFLPEDTKALAKYDMPLPIGFGQTNSQPTTVKLMINWLNPMPGNVCLDIGSGSGWTTAILAKIVGQEGFIYAVERISELVKMGQENCQKLNIVNVKFFLASKKLGLIKNAPYDRILVSAAAKKFPTELNKQLRVNGKMVIPINNDILEVTKLSDDKYEIIEHNGFAFVPLI